MVIFWSLINHQLTWQRRWCPPFHTLPNDDRFCASICLPENHFPSHQSVRVPIRVCWRGTIPRLGELQNWPFVPLVGHPIQWWEGNGGMSLIRKATPAKEAELEQLLQEEALRCVLLEEWASSTTTPQDVDWCSEPVQEYYLLRIATQSLEFQVLNTPGWSVDHLEKTWHRWTDIPVPKSRINILASFACLFLLPCQQQNIHAVLLDCPWQLQRSICVEVPWQLIYPKLVNFVYNYLQGMQVRSVV